MKTWRQLNLRGQGSISRVCAEFRVGTTLLPNAGFRIKVSEGVNDFIALPNVAPLRPNGDEDWICGIGNSECEAVQDLLDRLMPMLNEKKSWDEAELAWAHPNDF